MHFRYSHELRVLKRLLRMAEAGAFLQKIVKTNQEPGTLGVFGKRVIITADGRRVLEFTTPSCELRDYRPSHELIHWNDEDVCTSPLSQSTSSALLLSITQDQIDDQNGRGKKPENQETDIQKTIMNLKVRRSEEQKYEKQSR